jgi:hypothetical protein
MLTELTSVGGSIFCHLGKRSPSLTQVFLSINMAHEGHIGSYFQTFASRRELL